MQYKGYEIQITGEGCIIRNGNGDYIVSTPDETEAKEYIDDLEDEIAASKELTTNWYKRFEQYCKNLPGKCYPIEDKTKFGTIYGKALEKYVNSFKAATNTSIVIETRIIGEEMFYIVMEVYKN